MNLRTLFFLALPLNAFLDIILLFFEKGGSIAYIRGGILFFLIIAVLKQRFRIVQTNIYIFLFGIFTAVIILFSANIEYSLKVSAQVLSSILFFFVGYRFVSDSNSLKFLNISLLVLMFILVINYVFTSVLHLGVYTYEKNVGLTAGNLYDNWNIATYSLIVAFFIFKQSSKGFFKLILIVLSAVLLLFLIASFKRIAVSGFVFGFVLFLLFDPKYFRSFKYLLGFISVFLLFFPFVSDAFYQQYDFRMKQGRLQTDFYESEARYLESQVVWSEAFSFENLPKSLFGLEAFNSIGTYGNGMFGDRQIHVDYNLILNTLGIFGLILYLLIFGKLLKKLIVYWQIPQLRKYYPHHLVLYLILIILPLYTSLSGQMYAVTFRIIIFTYLGGLSRILDDQSSKINK